MDLDTIPFIQARQWRAVPPRPLDLIVIHDMETWETPLTAENLGAYFGRLDDRKASTHYGVDCDTVVQYVDVVTGVAYGAGGANHNGIHIEHAGFAAQTRDEWLDDYGRAMLVLSAELVRALCARHGIPRVFVDAAGLLRGERGITTHVEVCRAFGGDHTDPGPNFPLDHYMALVQMEDDMTPEQDAMLREVHAALRGSMPVAVDGGTADNLAVLGGWTYAQASFQTGTVAERRLREIVRSELVASRVASGSGGPSLDELEARMVKAVKTAMREGAGA